MGVLYYGNSSYSVEIDDRPLSHLKIVVLSMLRAGMGVAFSFERPLDAGSGRETLWISPSTEIRFRFNGSRPPRINQAWLRALIATVDAPTGLHLVAEPAEVAEPVLVKA
jgi:hypothetical protein